MRTCIICRKDKDETEFNDEHVIPDSIDGYYHIFSVCTTCNSFIGSKIDNKLTNHQFVKFQRHTLKIKGKSGTIPNPFDGTHTLKEDENQKLRLELDAEGKFEIKLLPNVPKQITDNFQIIIDQKDENKTDEIINKFLTRNGISKDKVRIDKKYSSKERPWVHASMQIDIKDFKMGLLKIAYEFAVDSIPKYFNDSNAITISKILKNADFEKLYDNIAFIGDGLNKEILKPFSHLIDFENNNHYLILFDSDDIGLIGFVNLFNVFNIGIRLSDKSGFIQESMIVGKNDLEKKNFKKYTLNQIVSHTYSPIEYRFQYFIPSDKVLLQEFIQNDKAEDFGFYKIGEEIPFFKRNGEVVYSNIELKLNQEQLTKIPFGDTINELITQINLDEELYIKLLPINKLYRVVSVRIEQYRKRKI